MPTLRLAIDGSAARIGANVFIQELNRIRVAAGVVRPLLSGIFGPLITGPLLYRALADIQNFEYALTQLAGVTGATAEQMALLSKSAREFGTVGVKNAYDAADAFLILSKAGLKTGEILQATPAILDMATAHAMGLESATRMVANTMTQFGLSADQTRRVVDVMTKASFESTIEIEDIAKSLKFAGVTASQTGESIEETAAMIAVLGNEGMRGALAGTYLRGVLGSLLKPTQVTTDALNKLGKDVRNLNPAMRPAVEIFQELHDAGMTLQDAFKVFGVFRANAAYTLIKSVDDVKALKEEFVGASGVTKKLADLMANTLLGSLKRLRAAFYELSIQVGEAGLLDIAKSASAGLRNIVFAIGGLDDHIEGNVEKVKKWARIIESVVGGVLVNVFLSSIYAVVKALAALSFAIMTNPIGLLLGSIGAVAGAFIYFRDTLITVGDQSGTVTDFVIASWEYVRDFFKVMWPFIAAGAESTWNYIYDTAVSVVKQLVDLFAGEGGTDQWGFVFAVFVENTRKVANFIIASGYAVKDFIRGIFDDIQMAMTSFSVHFDGTVGGMVLGAAAALEQFKAENIMAATLVATERYKKDYIATVVDFAKAGKAAIIDEFKKSAYEQGVDPFKFMSLVAAQQSIVNRADELRRAREEAEKLRQEQLRLAEAEIGPVRSGINGVTDALEEEGSAMDDLFRKEEAAIDRLNEMIDAYKLEADSVFLNVNAQERLKAMREAERIALNANLTLEKEYVDVLNAELTKVQQLRAQKYFNDAVKSLREEASLINYTNEERQIRERLLEAEQTAIEANLQSSDEYLVNLERELRLVSRMHQAKQLADDVGRAFSDSFADIVIGAKSAEEAISDLGLTIYKMLLNEMVGKTIAGLVSGVFYQTFGTMFTPSAHGNVFESGGIVPFARGGVARRPTMTPMANGGTALFAENGPEAVMPLQRMPDGRLGVASASGGGARPIVVNVHINTPDANSFRRSQAQIANDMHKAIGKATRTL